MIVFVVSCLLARFRGQPENSGKRGSYIRKSFDVVWERERERERERGYKGNWKMNGSFLKSRSWQQLTPKLKIERYQQQIGRRLWLVERNSTERPLEWTQHRRQEKKISWRPVPEVWRCVENYGTHFGWAPRRSPTPVKKNNTKVCVCLFRPYDGLFLYLFKGVDSVHTLFLSSRRLRSKGSRK